MSIRKPVLVVAAAAALYVGYRWWSSGSTVDLDPDVDWDLAVHAKTGRIGELVGYLKDHPQGAHVADAHAKLGERFAAVTARLHAHGAPAPALDALLAWLAAHQTNVVAVKVAPPAAEGLAALDAQLARASTPAEPIAPIAPHFGPAAAGDLEGRLRSALGDRFAAALGDDAVVFDAPADAPAGGPVLEVAWKVRGSDTVFHSAMGKRRFAGIAMDFDVTLRVPGAAPLAFSTAGAPPAEFKARTELPGLTMQYPSSNVEDANVYGGMAEAAFGTLGDALLARLAVTPPASATASPLDRARRWCEDQHDGPSCVELAEAYRTGDGVPVDKARAAELLRGPCLLDTGRACVVLARMELAGDGVPKDAIRGAMDAENGCHDNDGESCRLHAQLLARTAEVAPMLDDHEAPQPERALVYFVKACDLRDADGCREAAARFEHGTGVERSAAAAAVLARRACDAEAAARGADAGACPDADRLDKLAARAPTRRILDVALPPGAAVYDVRYQMPYEEDPMVTVWVATRLARDALFAQLDRGGAKAAIDVEDPADAHRPATSPPPGWAVTLMGVHRAGQGKACAPCVAGGGMFAGSAFCECPP